MPSDKYIVLRVESHSKLGDPSSYWNRRSFGPPDQAESMAVKLDEQELQTKREKADIQREPTVWGVAPVIPTQLHKPTASEEAAAPEQEGFTWGLLATNVSLSPWTGRNVTVAILDSGIDAQHEAFQGVDILQKDFTGEGTHDGNGHGTHVAGTVFGQPVTGLRFGVAPGIKRALIGKVLDSEGRGTTGQIYQAILWAAEEGAHVINMSLGLDYPGLVQSLIEDDLPADLATSLALEGYRANLRLFDTLSELIRRRASLFQSTLMVAAAGNESRRDIHPDYEITVSPPAAAEGIISVGALESEGDPQERLSVASFSNSEPTISAPGVSIYSSWPNNTYRSLDGTSMASPHVAGIAALWAEKLLFERNQLNLREFGSTLLGRTSRDKLVPDTEALDVGAGLVQAPLD